MKKIEAVFQSAVKAHQQGDHDKAISLYRLVLSQKSSHEYALSNLGSLLRICGRVDEGLFLLKSAVSLNTNEPSSPYKLGNALRDTGDEAGAIACFQEALRRDSKHVLARYNLALIYFAQHNNAEACAEFESVLAVDSAHHDARNGLIQCLLRLGRLALAQAELRYCIQKSPMDWSLWMLLGTVQQDMGEPSDALASYRRAAELAPGDHGRVSNLLMGLQYMPDVDNKEILRIAKSFGERFPESPPLKKEGRPEIIGFVSADFCSHPVGLFFLKVLENLDRERFKVVCYSNGAYEDIVTAKIRELCRWRKVVGMPDAALKMQIEADGVDALFDLSGHTNGNRLPMFAMRAAPLQVSWLGYFSTTGLSAMDYLVMDPYHAPGGTEEFFTERVFRLPSSRFLYNPVPFAPEVHVSPASVRDHVTFGSFNNTSKLNNLVIETWSMVLKMVPKSRLVLKWRTFADLDFRQQTMERFIRFGIDTGRIELRSWSSHEQMLNEYADIDIALDPFPFSGGHTSCEALWMGVPLVTFPSARPVSRQGFCFLANLGREEWVATDTHDYVALAAALAESPQTLQTIRRNLREAMKVSPLMDVNLFVKDFQSMIVSMFST